MGLSGIYFRSKVDGKWTNVMFEDLTEAEQDGMLDNRDSEWKNEMIKKLSRVLKDISEQFIIE